MPINAIKSESSTISKKEQLEARLKNEGLVYISVTGLSLKRPWHLIPFLRYAIPSKMQAEAAEGNLFVATRHIKGVNHTLTAWTSKKAMLQFAYSGQHAKAIKVFHSFFSGATVGFNSNKLPSWDEALEQLHANGKSYAKK